MTYGDRELETYDLWALGEILQKLLEAEQKRDKASKHPKFLKMEFPPPNPEFLKLKNEVEKEIRKKQGV